MNEDRIVGRIIPAEGSEDATFEIVDGRRRKYGNDACHHSRFILDKRWNTVECGKCGERVDPFAALLTYAEWELEWKQSEYRHKEAAKKLIVENLRRLRRLRDVKDEEVERINATLDKRGRLSLEELREVERPIEKAINERKRKKREARRRQKNRV